MPLLWVVVFSPKAVCITDLLRVVLSHREHVVEGGLVSEAISPLTYH
jgi:hypothetical protein